MEQNPIRHRFCLLILLTASVLPFSSSLVNEFVWLDHLEIEEGGYRLVDPGDLSLMLTQPLDNYLERKHDSFEAEGGYWRPVYGLNLTLD